MRLLRLAVISGVTALGLLTGAQASAQTQIGGGSNLLSQGHADQLGAWLGEGPIKISRIFTKSQDGASPAAFHAAADGKGRTFSVMAVSGTFGNRLIGGYNPHSWDSFTDKRITGPDSERTAFLFDLSLGIKRPQDLGTGAGQYQTINFPTVGPTFGLGPDLVTYSALSEGYSQGHSYNGGGPTSTNNLFGLDGTTYFSIGEMEVFTIGPADAQAAVTPEPASALLLLPGLAVAGTLRKRRSTKVA